MNNRSSDCAGGVAAIVASAGFSRRMGRFKPLLPWGTGTVIEAVVERLGQGGATPALVVTGHRGDDIAACLAESPARVLPNPDYMRDEMVRSFHVGLRELIVGYSQVQGALLALGDQPHIPAGVIREIINKAAASPRAVVIPSHNRRRGHPVYLPRRLFASLLQLDRGKSLRDFLNQHSQEIVYVPLDDDGIRRDMDLPEEYDALRAEYS